MQVLKFGGSSVGDATCISGVLDIVSAAVPKDRVILVSSAIKGCTDTLIEIGSVSGGERKPLIDGLRKAHSDIITRLFTGAERAAALEETGDLLDRLAGEDGDVCQTYGELLSTRIIARKLVSDGFNALWLDSRELVVRDDPAETYERIGKAVGGHPEVDIFVVPGFIARDRNGRVCTLGRGGSDLSAALYAAATGAGILQIWTDVPGVMTANPREVEKARTIPEMSYDAAFYLAGHGAKVLYAPTVSPVREAGIDICILNTFDPGAGGTVISDAKAAGAGGFLGISRVGNGIFLVSDGGIDPAAEFRRCERALEASGISCTLIGSDSSHLEVCVPEGTEIQALKVLHHEFFEKTSDYVDIYIAGVGAVGSELCRLIENNGASIARQSGKSLRIAGLARHENEDDALVRAMARSRGHQAVFVDCTNSESIYKRYIPILESGVSIVSSNRRAFSVSYPEYSAIKAAALRNGCFLRYETTVGTSLPMLGPLAAAAAGGDRVISLEAVVSCTLNRIFSSGGDFTAALRKAQAEGLTEKDPRADLDGLDALRKLLILAREAGIPLEKEDVKITPVLPREYFEGSLDGFYRRLDEAAPRFGTDQRFVAGLVLDEASPKGYRAFIEVRTMPEDHPAYWLTGTDNAIILHSSFHTSPLVIRGSGEGAKGAAASILYDILK